VGCVCRVKRFTAGGKYYADDHEVETEMWRQLRQQSKGFYAGGFDALVNRWDMCINVWWRICWEIDVFSRFEYHMFYVIYPFVTYLWLSLVLITLPESWHGSDHVSDDNKSNEEDEPLSCSCLPPSHEVSVIADRGAVEFSRNTSNEDRSTPRREHTGFSASLWHIDTTLSASFFKLHMKSLKDRNSHWNHWHGLLVSAFFTYPSCPIRHFFNLINVIILSEF
jgi:hypothetical protein